ncbi:MAG: hypothetical protein LC667_18910, partial [Thioalkalivibrio sp.]|nr:hypothetical protein [Thioalkalivibrio sp.]
WLLGDTFLERGRVSEALFAYRAATNLLDRHYILLAHVTARLIDLERYEGAEGLLRITIEDYPDLPIAYGQLAGIRAVLGDAAEAERHARAMLELHPTDPVRQHVLAWALAAQGEWDEAVDERRKADALGPVDFWHRWVYDAYLLRRASDLEGMAAALDSARLKVATEAGAVALDSILAQDFPQVSETVAPM